MRITVRAMSSAFVLLLASMASAAGPVSGPIVNPANGHTYYLLGPDTWAGDETSAQALGGTLATVRSALEDAWIYTTFTPLSHTNLWIGLTDPSRDTVGGAIHAANFVWASGDPSTYRNWATGEPNNNDGASWYTLLQYQTYNLVQPLQWNDVPNQQGATYGVAEILPVEGDLNGDGGVGFDDLPILAQHYGRPGIYAQGDINGDGRVNFEDLLILAQHYGVNASSRATAAQVPEPCVACVAAGFSLLARRNRRGRQG